MSARSEFDSGVREYLHRKGRTCVTNPRNSPAQSAVRVVTVYIGVIVFLCPARTTQPPRVMHRQSWTPIARRL